ncbi:MarR family winged helix-turn-helix transcriptional regulator [Sphingobacterium psychroaquaticum]|uniref:DNA-binding transcriptional regulator, MarR family n=1 Tax=Sphingobacterium psychroaquaticum TaxID=561061 RepID=A0A1X7IY72_9SPHI|nr:MarR family winged helix-turn-helix transcriptional regulator [Sphingobacterium psychroaquaticum]SMG20126.1 DNA-binding transcriptional regulator, MarR family [Sphingobacterium psychroaquaticum]
MIDKSDFLEENDGHEIEAKIIASLERISQSFRVLLWKESVEFGLSPIQIQVLIFLLNHSEERRKVSLLAQEFDLSKATISDTIKILAQKELITKEYGGSDTRSYTIDLSKKGRDIALQTSSFTREIRKPIDKLGAHDKEQLLLNLLDIIAHLNQAGIISIQRMCSTCSYYSTTEDQIPHFCKLLNKPLHVGDLKIDCSDYQQVTL